MRSLRFFWRYITYRKGLLAFMLSLSLVVAASELYIPWLVMKAINSVIVERSIANLDTWAFKALIMLALFYVLHAVLIRVEAQLILQSSYNLRRRLYTHILSQAMPFFQRHRTGELIHRCFTDAEIFEEDAEDLFGEVPFEFMTAIGVTIMMAFLDLNLALMVIAFMIVNIAVTFYLGRPLLNIEKTLQRIGARLASRLQESITGIRTVQGFKNEQFELAKLDKDSREILETELKEGRIESFLEPLADIVELLGLVLIVWYGGHLIIAGELTIGGLVAFIAYMEILSGPLSEIEGFYRDYLSCRAMAERLQDLFDDNETLAVTKNLEPRNDDWRVEVSGVGFRHAGSDRDILRDVSLSAGRGEIVAIAGRNGAGKSTLLDLFLRFYDPDAGTLSVDGVDLRDLNLEQWRNAVGIMSQDVFLFHGTILENIAYARPDATPKEVKQAARDAGIDKLALKFANGLDTIVGERGSTVSGGERQRIALARLFLRNPRVLLLDEPTAHLDGEALQVTLELLKKLMARCTTFIVTHQAETIEFADRVIFLDHGEVVAQGTHQVLFAENESYRSLWSNQPEKRPAARRRMPRREIKRRRQGAPAR